MDLTESDVVLAEPTDGGLNRKELINSLEYITELAKRVVQPPPKLYDDPKIDECYNTIRNFIEQYGKSQV